MDKQGDDNQQAEHFRKLRERMVDRQIAGRGIRHPAVLAAMRIVPRELFVPEEYRSFAYDDTPLPIPADQTISQPFIVAYMIAALDLEPDDRVLEIGTGSGYAAAVLSRIVTEVYTVERHHTLANYARLRLVQTGYQNVHVLHSDGTRGWPEHAPYDGIIVAAGGPVIPEALQQQLAIGGRLIMPIGRSRLQQNLILLTRVNEDVFTDEALAPVAFVPLIGDDGWPNY